MNDQATYNNLYMKDQAMYNRAGLTP